MNKSGTASRWMTAIPELFGTGQDILPVSLCNCICTTIDTNYYYDFRHDDQDERLGPVDSLPR